MGSELNKLGVHIEEKIAIQDTKDGIISGIDRAMSKGDIVLITGGLGPTKDDITKKVIADHFGMNMVFNDPTWERIEALFARWGRSTTPAHREQCYMPDLAKILENKMGTAPGMLFEVDGKVLISMPGVPYEMKYIMEHSVLPMIKENFTNQSIIHHTILTAGEGESRIASQIEDVVNQFPKHISIAYLPNLGTVKLRITAKGPNEELLKAEAKKYGDQIENILGDLVYGHDNESLGSVIGKIALEKKLKIGTAESCTGGLVASKLVTVSGASAYFEGSIVTYSYRLKETILKVNPQTLIKYGAVSEETVIEMVTGTINHLGVDVAVAISGIAGPGGGTEDKPVGTVWIACGNKSKTVTLKIQAGKDRQKNIEYASNYAMNVLRKFLQAQ
jgi:nicotinamide-nucleotide amidase